jgi:hypothetical protein
MHISVLSCRSFSNARENQIYISNIKVQKLRQIVVEQDLFTLLEHMSSPHVCSGIRVAQSELLVLQEMARSCTKMYIIILFFSV